VSPLGEPCCGCVPQPPPVAAIESNEIVQRPAQRVELLVEAIDDQTAGPENPAD